MLRNEAKCVSEGDKYMTASWITPDEVAPKPKQWDAKNYCVKPSNVMSLDDGHVFDLGDRKFDVIHIPGHSPGSIALHDRHGYLRNLQGCEYQGFK